MCRLAWDIQSKLNIHTIIAPSHELFYNEEDDYGGNVILHGHWDPCQRKGSIKLGHGLLTYIMPVLHI